MKKKNFNTMFLKYNKVIIASFLFFIFCYVFKLFTYSYSLDTEAFMIYPESFLDSWLQINRFSLVGLKKIFSFIPFNIIFTNWLTLIFFFGASLLTYYNFARIYPKMKSPKKALFFLMIIGSSPIFLEQFNFTLQSAEIAFFLILFQVGILFLEKYIEQKKKSLLLYVILIECFCLGAYQSFAPLFITEVIIILYLKIDTKKIIGYKSIWKYIGITVTIFLISFILYNLLASNILKLTNLTSSEYLYNQIAWFNKPFLENVIQIMKTIALMYFSCGYLIQSHYHYTLLNSFVLIVGLIVCYKKLRTRNYFEAILFLGILFCPLLMTFLLGSNEPLRAQLVLPIVLAFVTVYSWQDKKWYTIIVSLLVIGQMLVMGVLEYNDYLRFENDKAMASQIYEKVKEYLPNRKLVFVGAKDSDVNGKILVKGEAMGISFFDHYGLSDRATTFMKTLGFPINDDRAFIDEAVLLVQNMACYPSDNSILVTDTHVIVKLS